MNASGNRRGVQKATVAGDRAGQRLDNFLLARLPGVPRSLVYRLIRTGQVRVNGGRAKPAQKLRSGDEVRIPPVQVDEHGPPRVPDPVIRMLEERVIHEDAGLLALDKPAGLAVHGGTGIRWGIVDALRQSRAQPDLELAHRLDRETSGVLVLAKTRPMLTHLHRAFAGRETDKRYLALLDGRLPEDLVRVDQALARAERGGERYMATDPEGKPSVTEFRRLHDHPAASFVEATPVTGRTHQIRAHAAALGTPCAGDARYGGKDRVRYWRGRGLERLFLHAGALSLPLPGGDSLQLSAPLPEDLKRVLDGL